MINKLKSEKGITLISLIVYVIVMLVVITIIGTITSYFYANVNTQYEDSKDENGETTLDMYLNSDLKNKKIILETGNSEENLEEGTKTIKLIYEDNSVIAYTITDDGIYRNAVKIYNIDNSDIVFSLGEIISSTNNNVIYEKQELKLEKISEETGKREVFKSYIINIETKAIYPTN